jgi:hypothetical protein
MGRYLNKNGNNREIKLLSALKRREWFTGLWMNTNNMKTQTFFCFAITILGLPVKYPAFFFCE